MTNQQIPSPTTVPDLDWDSLQVLGRSSTVTISLGYDPKGSRRYFVKTPIKRGSASSDIEAKLRFKRELDNAAALDHPGIASPFPLFDNELKGIIYSADGAGLLSRAASEKILAPEVVVDAGVQILDALEYLHRRGIVHGNITPQTISIDTAQQVRFLDLGYVITDSGKSPSDGEVIGTFPYLSPEQMGITEFGIDSRSDLFCVAAMLYRLISGVYPFPGGEIGIRKLMEEIVRTEPRPLPTGSPFLNGVFLKALHASPTERYQTAEGFRHDLVLALSELRDSISVTAKPGSRDRIASVNSADVFVGREGEIGLLRRMLENLISYRKPSSLLVYGISGVGKTGLVREFERQLNPEECLFLSSKCNRHTTTQPYALINGLILDLLIKVSRMEPQVRDRTLAHLDSKLANHSGVLCRSIPELSGIFRNVREIDQIEPEKESARVHFTMTAFLEEISRFIPLVIFADDFQWADRGSFEVFRRFAGCESQFLLVCSYRTPAPEALPRIEDLDLTTLFGSSIQVKAFLKGEISELLASCFGTLDGIESLSGSLYDRTDRLPLTLRESMRFVVNSGMLVPSGIGWRLRQDALVPFPQRFDFPSLILDKLKNLEEQDRTYLEWASLIEGKFDPKLIIEAAGLESSAAGEIRNRLVQQGFLVRRYGGLLAFSHDKIQESIAGGVGEERQRGMHLVLGGIFEALSHENQSVLGTSAEHLAKSTDWRRAVIMCIRAADAGIKVAAFESAIKYYETAIDILSDSGKRMPDTKFIDLQIALGDLYTKTGKNESALNVFESVLRNCDFDKLKHYEIEYKIGSILHSMGEFSKSTAYLTNVISKAGVSLPNMQGIQLFRLLFCFLKLRIFPDWIARRKSNNTIAPRVVLRTSTRLAYSLYFENIPLAFHIQLKSLSLATHIENCYEKAEAFAIHAVPAFLMFAAKRARQYCEKSEAIATAINRNDALAFSQCFRGIVEYYAGEWKDAEKFFKESLRTYQTVGEEWGQVTPLEHLGYIAFYRGDFEKCLELIESQRKLCDKCSDRRGFLLTLRMELLCNSITGRTICYKEIEDNRVGVNTAVMQTLVDWCIAYVRFLSSGPSTSYALSKLAISEVLNRRYYLYEYMCKSFTDHCEILIHEYRKREHGFTRIEITDSKLLSELFKYSIFSDFRHAVRN